MSLNLVVMDTMGMEGVTMALDMVISPAMVITPAMDRTRCALVIRLETETKTNQN
jgi:hypothetical protein